MNEKVEFKWWTAKRKRELVEEFIHGKMGAVSAARDHDPKPSGLQQWVEEAEEGGR